MTIYHLISRDVTGKKPCSLNSILGTYDGYKSIQNFSWNLLRRIEDTVIVGLRRRRPLFIVSLTRIEYLQIHHLIPFIDLYREFLYTQNILSWSILRYVRNTRLSFVKTRKVLWKLYWYYIGAAMTMHWYYTGTTSEQYWYYKGAVMPIHWYYMGTILALHWYYTVAALAIYWYYTGTTFVLYENYTVGAMVTQVSKIGLNLDYAMKRQNIWH